ncbi:MAG: protein-disulfide reductase DsbD [Gammaproteobacteria bacterium]|nr:protein-disulfide reductase DsbD [Gammaproteobacteria bacterium]MDH5803237.1 protein-disulfide reductase DsbD [Gammaproteobacteria bacterium]
MKIHSILAGLLALLFCHPSFAAVGNLGISDEEPLPVEQAFVMSSQVLSADMVRISFDITDGYYLYRSKFKFDSNTPSVTLGQAVFPKGKVKTDEFFGKVETYRGRINIDIPVIRSNNDSKLDLSVTSQGCADLGLCYPPQKQIVSLVLPSQATQSDNDGFDPLGAIKSLGNRLGLGNNDDEFLRPEQAFVFSAEAENGNLIRAHWDIEDGYYLYRDKYKFTLKNAEGISLGEISMPPGKEKVDESFGKMVVYYKSVDIYLPLDRSHTDAVNLELEANYQGCADKGLCYPPQTMTMPVSLPAGQLGLPQQTPAQSGNSNNQDLSEQDRLANMLQNGSLLLTLLAFYFAGVGLAFTPCVFPMVPILSSIIAGQKNVTTKKAFTMSLVYVLAMALTYTVAGVVAGLFGNNLQAAFQNPWILSTFSAVFVALAFSMFGFFEIQMPASIQSRLTEISNRQEGGTLAGVAIMGLLSALIVGPCVAAPLMGALIYIGQTGDAVLGGFALFALSMGMGTPLLAIGASAGTLLPKAGQWMDTIKAVFGVLMLAVAVWMLERIVPAAVSMILWALLLIVPAIYMGALEPLNGASGWKKLWKGLGLFFLTYGILILIGVSSGGRDVLQPLDKLMQSRGGNNIGGNSTKLNFVTIKGIDGLERALEQARTQQQVAMLDFYAEWCVSCKEMEKYTFGDPGVQQALKNVMLLKADVTANDAVDQALMKKLGVVGPPSIHFFDRNGEEQRALRLVGFLDKDKFKALVQKATQ